MMALLFLRLSEIAFLFSYVVESAQQTSPISSGECQAAHQEVPPPRNAGVDSVSLMQSRGIKVDIGGEGPVAAKPKMQAQAKPQSVKVSTLIEESEALKMMSTWSFILTSVLFIGICIGIFVFVAHLSAQRHKEDLLEARTSSVLQRQPLAKEENVPVPAGSPLRSPLQPQLAGRNTPMMQSRLSPNIQEAMPFQTLPSLNKSDPPLASEVRLLLQGQNVQVARSGGDIIMTNEQGRPVVRATVRKVDDDRFLEVTTIQDDAGTHSTGPMVQLARKDASWSSPNAFGHEIFTPEGNAYGTLQMRSGGGQLVLANTTHPALIIDGDLKNLQFAVRKPNGIELASLSKADRLSPPSQYLRIRGGNDLALIVACVLSVVISS